MIYGIETDQYGGISDSIDVPEAKKILLRYFDLLPEEEDHDEELGKEIIKLFKSRYEKILHLLIDTGIGYPTLIILSRNINPEFWTSQNVMSIRNRHKLLMNTLNSGGEFNFKISDAKEAKRLLLRYFDLLPEEENHNEDLLKELISIIKKEGDFDDLLKLTAIDPLIIMYIIEDLDPKFFATGRGKQTKDKIVKRILS